MEIRDKFNDMHTSGSFGFIRMRMLQLFQKRQYFEARRRDRYLFLNLAILSIIIIIL